MGPHTHYHTPAYTHKHIANNNTNTHPCNNTQIHTRTDTQTHRQMRVSMQAVLFERERGGGEKERERETTRTSALSHIRWLAHTRKDVQARGRAHTLTNTLKSHQFTKPAHRADQAAFAHTMKAPAPSLSLGGGLIYSLRCCTWDQIEHSPASHRGAFERVCV